MAKCLHCGSSIAWGDTKTKINGGVVCSTCAPLAGLDVEGVYNINYQGYLYHLHSNKRLKEFNSKKGLLKYCDGHLLVDEESKTFGIGCPVNSGLVSFQTASLDGILELQLFDNNHTYQVKTKDASSGAGKALVGGLLFGGVGAIAGGLVGRSGPEYEQVSEITRLGFSVVYENGKCENFNILYLLFGYYSMSPEHQLLPEIRGIIAALCEAMYPYTKAGKEIAEQAKLREMNAKENLAKQILEAASLVEKGLLTKEEYEILKQKVLS